jgi:sugar/nucleoside kinase (ribokinase family)
MTLPLDMITFGEAMMLLVADQPGPFEQVESFHKRSAGAETNVAIGLARLGLKVGWASRLGTDSMGRFLLAAMKSEGIDCSKVTFDAEAGTGLMFKGKTTDGSDPPSNTTAMAQPPAAWARPTSTRPGWAAHVTFTPPACLPPSQPPRWPPHSKAWT